MLREWRTEIRACCAAVLARCGARRGPLSPGRGRRAAPAPEQSYTPEANAIEVTSPPPARGDNQRAGGGVSTPALPPPASEGGAGLEAGRSTAGLDAPPAAGTRRVAWAEEVLMTSPLTTLRRLCGLSPAQAAGVAHGGGGGGGEGGGEGGGVGGASGPTEPPPRPWVPPASWFAPPPNPSQRAVLQALEVSSPLPSNLNPYPYPYPLTLTLTLTL